MKTRTYSIIWCATYYTVLAFDGACQPFMLSLDSSANTLSLLAVALSPTYWLVNDAKRRRIHVPHVIQPVLLSLWGILVPIYLVWTRKWWGLLYALLHIVCSVLATTIFYNLSLFFVFPIVFPSAGG